MSFAAPLPAWVPISQPFKPGQHLGIDWAAPLGTDCYAAETGFVRYGPTDEPGGYGNTITLEHADGWESRYAHLSTFYVTHGQTVQRGQLVALTGGAAGAPGSGSSTGPHLHHELRQHGVAVDPYPLLTWGGQIPGDLEDEMTPEQMDTLAGWMQDQTNVILKCLVGAGWGGNEAILAAWAWDTREIVNAHTSAVVDGGADAIAAEIDAVEAAVPTLELEAARDA